MDSQASPTDRRDARIAVAVFVVTVVAVLCLGWSAVSPAALLLTGLIARPVLAVLCKRRYHVGLLTGYAAAEATFVVGIFGASLFGAVLTGMTSALAVGLGAIVVLVLVCVLSVFRAVRASRLRGTAPRAYYVTRAWTGVACAASALVGVIVAGTVLALALTAL